MKRPAPPPRYRSAAAYVQRREQVAAVIAARVALHAGRVVPLGQAARPSWLAEVEAIAARAWDDEAAAD